MKQEWRKELETICQSGYLHDTGGLEAVARFVLADADCWRQRLGMGPIAPEVAGYHHHTTEPHAPYALPTVQAVAGNLSYGPPRSLEERLARASLSGAEGQE